MTGPEHYKRAEELLADVTRDDGSVDFGEGGEAYVAAAQVHATLALAAATALRHEEPWFPDASMRDDGSKWSGAAG